jgi:hypothetical protein
MTTRKAPKTPQLVSLFACGGLELWRHAQPGTGNQPMVPERVTIADRQKGRSFELVGQDATDLLDQMTHARDGRHMRDIVRDALALQAA